MWISDTLRNLVSGLGSAKDKASFDHHVFMPLSKQQIDAAYRGDWVARKAIDIPPHDEVKNGRDWQAENDQIELIEAEEKRLGLWKKLLRVRTLARLYGGAAIVIGASDATPDLPLVSTRVGKAGLVYLHVLTRYEISAGQVDLDVTSPFYGEPQYWEVRGVNGTIARIHPSRVIRFVGNETPDPFATGMPYWGDSVLESIIDAVRHVGLAHQGVAALIHEAKLDVFKIPNLSQNLSSDAYSDTLTKRFTNANMLKSLVNAVVLDTEEEHDQKQISFATLPEIMDRYMQAVSGAADIPTTRMLGQAPQGMNSTGDGDYKNYLDRIAAGQELELRPALEPLDEVLIRSALGARDPVIHYTWAPLWQLSEKEKADIAFAKAQATQIYVNTALVPIDALAKATCNQLVEDGTYPGLEAALEESAEEPGDALQASEEEAAAGQMADPEQGGGPNADRPFVGDGYNPRQLRGPNGRWLALEAKLDALWDHIGTSAAARIRMGSVRRPAQMSAIVGKDVRGFKHAADAQAVRHMFNNHGDHVLEAKRGQVAVERADLQRIPEIVRTTPTLSSETGKHGEPRLEYRKTIGNVEYVYVAEVHRKKRRIDAVTMRKH